MKGIITKIFRDNMLHEKNKTPYVNRYAILRIRKNSFFYLGSFIFDVFS